MTRGLFRIRLSFCAMLAVALTGCPRAPHFEPPGSAMSPDMAGRFCQFLSSEHPAPSEVRALADASFQRGDEKYSFRYVIALKEPDKLRIDILPTEGAFTLGMLVSSGTGATVIDTQNKTYSTADNVDLLVSRFLGIEGLTRSTIVGLVSGTLPPIDCSKVRVYSGNDAALVYDEDRHTVWAVHPDSGQLSSVQVLDEEGSRVQVECSFPIGESEAANLIELRVYEPVRLGGTLAITRPVVPKPMSDALFQVKIPPSYTQAD